MSQEDALSRKERKAQRDADRKKKGKKRKHDEVEKDDKVAEQNEFDKDFLPLESEPVVAKDTSTKGKSKKDASRKRKTEKLDEPAVSNETKPDSEPAAEPKPKKCKKDKKDATTGASASEEGASGDKSHRFILFVGNLPYSATDITIRAHFKKLEPFKVRHRTDPKTGKSKGFAFLEFENYDRMKTCLKLYHHSMFDPNKTEPTVEEASTGDDQGPAKQKNAKAAKGARTINVELTSGGGGNAEGRKEKIRAKNVRLGEQRQRRADAERMREKKAREEGEGDGAKPAKKKVKRVEEAAVVPEEMGGMHPSRLARIAG